MAESNGHGRVLVVVPAYNEQDSIEAALADVRRHANFADILVVDDGSTDKTAARARAAGASVVTLPFNLGIGAAMQTGFKYAFERSYDAVVQFDGDGQHDASAIRLLLAGLARADVVIGSRYLRAGDYRAPVARRFGTLVFSMIVFLITRQRLTDTTSGFRALNRAAVRLCARAYPSDYPEVEILTTMHRAGLRLAEVPVSMNRRQAGKSSINWRRAVYYMVKVILAMFVGLLRERPAREEE